MLREDLHCFLFEAFSRFVESEHPIRVFQSLRACTEVYEESSAFPFRAHSISLQKTAELSWTERIEGVYKFHGFENISV